MLDICDKKRIKINNEKIDEEAERTTGNLGAVYLRRLYSKHLTAGAA